MKAFRIFAIISLAAAGALPLAAAERVGVQRQAIFAPDRQRDLSVLVWYPAEAGGSRVLVGEDRLFRGTEAWENAPLKPGVYPLILISHGSGGSIANLDWLASALAEAGFIVAGPNHPQTTRGNSTPIDTLKLWERAADLSAVLTEFTERPAWRKAIAVNRVGALGFSLGGHTVLSLAGVETNLDAYAQYCDTYRSMADCVWFARDALDIRKTDRRLFEKSNRDARFKSIVAVDPAVVHAYTVESLRSVAIPINLINLGSGPTIPTSVDSRKIATDLLNSSYTTVAEAVHLSFLAECQPTGQALLNDSGDTDPICDDAKDGSKTRAQLHAEIAEKIVALFQRDLIP